MENRITFNVGDLPSGSHAETAAIAGLLVLSGIAVGLELGSKQANQRSDDPVPRLIYPLLAGFLSK